MRRVMAQTTSPKATRGNFFEDFQTGQVIQHPTPRTLTEGDAAAYVSLYGDRRPLHSARSFAQALGLAREPMHDLHTIHTVFGKSVGQISLNAVANLGYADGRFLGHVHAGDTLRSESEVLGKKELSNGKAGIVWVRTRGLDQREREVLRYCRWVMVEKRDPGTPTGAADKIVLPESVPASELRAPAELDARRASKDLAWALGAHAWGRWDDYAVGERIDHVDGMTVDESDHTLATRLYQNTARVHFNLHQMAGSRFGKRLVYGGHIISIAYGLAQNGLEGSLGVLALNAGSHVNPTFAGDTIYAWTEVLDKQPLAGRDDVGALRVRLCAAKNVDPSKEPFERRTKNEKGEEVADPRLVLELDVWLMMVR
jgi:2-methylfumaryl-CoA hydratase